MANEENEFEPFITVLIQVLDELKSGKVYLIVDNVSLDATFELCQSISSSDNRFELVWAPQNRNVVDAYLKGYKIALNNKHTYIIEMDAGLSHDPRVLPMFLRALLEGNECAFGSRFINGGSMADSGFRRWFLSKFGTILSNFFLRTKMRDMTSGFQGFHRDIVGLFAEYPFLSKGHFFQTELRYLLRNRRYIEIPIHYKAPSASVSKKSLQNSCTSLLYYSLKRIFGKKIAL